MPATLTLTQNRSPGPQRFVRMVIYRTELVDGEPGRVMPYQVLYDGQLRIERLEWRDVLPSQVDPEFAEMWANHVHGRAQTEHASEAT